MTPHDIYYGDFVKKIDPSELSWCDALDHIPEVSFSYHDADFSVIDKFYVKQHVWFNCDGNRTVELCSIWFKDQPVMITQNAGRYGRDYSARFITDFEAYKNMVSYLLYFFTEHYETEVFGIDEEMGDKLTHFYNRDWPLGTNSSGWQEEAARKKKSRRFIPLR